jgi:ferrous iron transport protein A
MHPGLPATSALPFAADAGLLAADPCQTVLALHELPLRRAARVVELAGTGGVQPCERARQLAEVGFVPGETVSVLARAWPGGDPLVVRVGNSRFALRRAEAACVLVSALP